MSTEKTPAIVLRVVDFSETSAVVTLLTRQFGKITAMAKGARRPKSPFEAALDVLAICRIVFLHKNSESLDLLTEAKLERRFRNKSGKLERLYAAYYVAELAGALTDASDPQPQLFDLCHETLIALDEPGDDDQECLLRFELGALKLLGHNPSMNHCVECGKEKPVVREDSQRRRVYFGLIQGGVLCSQCRRGKQSVVSLSHEAWKTLAQWSQTAPARPPEFLPHERRGEIRQVMNQYISHLIGKRPRLQPYIMPSVSRRQATPPAGRSITSP